MLWYLNEFPSYFAIKEDLKFESDFYFEILAFGSYHFRGEEALTLLLILYPSELRLFKVIMLENALFHSETKSIVETLLKAVTNILGNPKEKPTIKTLRVDFEVSLAETVHLFYILTLPVFKPGRSETLLEEDWSHNNDTVNYNKHGGFSCAKKNKTTEN